MMLLLKKLLIRILLFTVFFLPGCSVQFVHVPTSTPTELVEFTVIPVATQTPTQAFLSIPPDLGKDVTYQVLNTYPHDRTAFTQGLVFYEGIFIESTGLYGQSSLRKVKVESGEVLQLKNFNEEYFCEGLTLFENTLFLLTWKENTAWALDIDTFEIKSTFTYSGEGWGLTHDNKYLIMSDGTSQLRFLDPNTFTEVHRIDILEDGRPIKNLNELEYINGEIYANVWQTDTILRIDPADGSILGKIDLSGLLLQEGFETRADVLNGIAYDPDTDRLFVTGKLWPYLFEIALLNR